MLNFQQKEKNMKKYFDVLKLCPLFCGIAEDELLPMLSCLGARVSGFDRHASIISEGDEAKFFGVVISGNVRIEQVDYFGNRSIVGRASTGDLFGESFACASVAFMPVNVVCEDASSILLLDNSRVMNPCSNVCSFHRQLIYNLMKIMAMKNLAFHQKIEITSKRTTREKLLAYLMSEAKRTGKSSFEIPFDRQSLADYLAVDRSGLSAEISKLRTEGLIESRRSFFKLL